MDYPTCGCINFGDRNWRRQEMKFHFDEQDTSCEAWRELLNYIDEIREHGGEEFVPFKVLGPDRYHDIVTLPKEIASLKTVKGIYLYASNISWFPPEIGGMENLEYFDVYTSNRLHWIPYEITRCQSLKDSRMSTRRFYGNYKNKAPFPYLEGNPMKLASHGDLCSVCGESIKSRPFQQCWISTWVATDEMPLLATVCSEGCLDRVPLCAKRSIVGPHLGGLGMNKRSSQ